LGLLLPIQGLRREPASSGSAASMSQRASGGTARMSRRHFPASFLSWLPWQRSPCSRRLAVRDRKFARTGCPPQAHPRRPRFISKPLPLSPGCRCLVNWPRATVSLRTTPRTLRLRSADSCRWPRSTMICVRLLCCLGTFAWAYCSLRLRSALKNQSLISESLSMRCKRLVVIRCTRSVLDK
jgi:hypothetical protein